MTTLNGFTDANFLSVNPSSPTGFMINDKPVYLNGLNEPWDNYGQDFGNNQPNSVFCNLNSTLATATENGGNSVRIWLHCDGSSTPEFNSQGDVIASDGANSMLSDLRLYLEAAAQMNMLVTISLWNGAVSIPSNLKGLITDSSKLQTYIDNVLTPLAKGLANETGLGAWEIINEPEGSVSIASNSEACFDTSPLQGTGAGWTGSNIAMSDFQRFVSMQTAAIHAANPRAIVTVGSWSEHSLTDEFGYRNYWKDECLDKAYSKSGNHLDFYQIHSYAWNGKYGEYAPFEVEESAYELDKPLIIGEFASKSSGGESPEYLYNYAYSNGYSGGWDWSAQAGDSEDDLNLCVEGMKSLKGKPYVAINVATDRVVPNRCDCSDIPPSNDYTCAQQAEWGKCGESWMVGYCCLSCHACQGCS